MKRFVFNPSTKGRYSTAQKAKTAARRNAPHLSWGQSVEVLQYNDGSFGWMVNTKPLPLPDGAVSVAYYDRFSNRWTTYA